MLNYFGNKELVPNGYVYTSYTGTKYVFLEGIWFYDSSTRMVDPRSYSNLYNSAQKQIFEHNSASSKQIGKTYIREGIEQVYVGNGRYTHNGTLFESDFSNFKKGDTSSVEVPNMFKLGDFTYHKNSNSWVNSNNKVASEQHNSELTNDAINKIKEYNKVDEYPVNSTIQYKGSTLTWNGVNWIGDDGKTYHNMLTDRVHSYIDENPEELQDDEPEETSTGVPDGYVYTSGKGKKYYKKKGEWFISGTTTKVNSSASQPLERTAAKQIESENANSELKIGSSKWTSKSGKVYTYVGEDRFISDDGKMLPKGMAEKAKNDILAKKDDHKEEDSEIKNDVDSDIDDKSTATPDDRHEEERQEQEKAIDDHDAKRDDRQEEGDKLKSLAERIKSNPKERKITVLLTRGDKLSLMAADILLSGKENEIKKILQSLNKKDD